LGQGALTAKCEILCDALNEWFKEW
jgi:hypothetical protein